MLFLWLICAFVCLQSLHHEMSLYLQQLKIDIEKGKLSDSISRLEKQINKEKKLIRRGRTKGLITEHEVVDLFPCPFGLLLGFFCKGRICPLPRIKSALKISSAILTPRDYSLCSSSFN